METAETVTTSETPITTEDSTPPKSVFGVGRTKGTVFHSRLTREEKTQIRKMFAKGMKRQDIADKVGISLRAVIGYKSRLNKQLGLDSLDKGALYSDDPRVVFKIKPPPQESRRGKRGPAKQLPMTPSLREAYGKVLPGTEPIPSLKEWVESNSIILDGEPLTFNKHEYLIEPYSEDHPFTVEEKASQMGITSLRMLTVMYRAKHRRYRGILYYFPSKTDVIDFSKTRILPLIEENPETMGNWIQETNSTTVKRLWNTYLYFRGMNSTIGLKSTPADFIVFDELDEAMEDRMVMALKRMSHSQYKEIAMLSNPTLPDYGINKQFQRCISPDTKVLTTDLRWHEAGRLTIGDELIGFDAEKPGDMKRRRYKVTYVTSTNRIDLPSLKLYFDDGTTVVCSKQHRWLTENGTNIRWHFAKNLKLGSKVFSIGTWKEKDSKLAGWMAGIFDGEGSIGRTTNPRGGEIITIGFGQNGGTVLEKVKETLASNNFDFSEHKQGAKCRGLVLRGGLPERLRFLGIFRPYRLMEQSRKAWEGISVGNDHGYTKKLKLVKKEDVGIPTLVALGTESGTYIANGLLSHNSDQRYWLLKCPKCNEYTCMEDTFPECIAEWNGKTVRLCQSCRDAELNPSVGQWVAKRPAITEIRGRHYSQLFSWFVTPQEVLDEFRTTNHMKHFQNLTIGVPYVEAENRLTIQQVLALCSDDGIVSSDDGPCSMGVDQMSKSLHVTIGKRVPNKAGKMVHIGIYKDWSDLDNLMKNFNVNRCVVDAMPELRNARSFAEKFKGRVFLNFYREHQRGSYKWDEENMTVMCNRTESLDASHYEMQEGIIILPKECDVVKTFAEHLHNVGKDLEENEETGSKRYIYKKLGEDHFRHSFNYECMARQYQVDLLFPELL